MLNAISCCTRTVMLSECHCVVVTNAAQPVFGVPLAATVERSPCHDGILLPIIVRECIDYVEEFGKLFIVYISFIINLSFSVASL
jgi:hypothetical protein